MLKRCKRLLSLMVMFAVIFSAVALTASAETVTETETEKSYDIAVVYDNSGSMYDNESWCRAKYAMEIFASMLDYKKDKLSIFPMWEVTTDGTQPSSGGTFGPIVIENEKGINKISNLFTVNPWNTPFEPIEEAERYLVNSNADEKWLVVLTDGEFNQEKRNDPLVSFDLQSKLSEKASEHIKVQYLGFGLAPELSSDEAKNFFAKKSSDTSLKDDLIEICNKIFQRSVLPSNRLKGTKLNLDLSMKNIIVFAQGKNAKITSLKDSTGKEVAITLNSGQRKYSNVSANGYENAPVDTTLAGQVVTFAACPKGEYTLSYSDADKIQVFYEPDVDLEVSIFNSDGVKIEKPEDMVAGNYKIVSKIVDAVTKEDVTTHELMGGNVDLKTLVKTSGDSDYTAYENGESIELAPGKGTEILVEGTYLGKYKISSKDNPELQWLLCLDVKEKPAEFKVDVTTEQDWYKLNDHDNWKPVKVTLSLNGQPLTKEQFTNTKISVSVEGLVCRYEPLPSESAYLVYIAQDENGNYTQPDTGKYKLTATAEYTDEFGKILPDYDSASFEVQKYSKIWRYLIWLLVFLALVAIWLIFMLQKVMPKNIVKDTASFRGMFSGELDSTFVDVTFERKSKSLTITTSPAIVSEERCSATFSLRAVDNRFTKSNSRRVAVIDINSTDCDEIRIVATRYVEYNGRWIKDSDLNKAKAGKEVSSIKKEINCRPEFVLKRSVATLTCRTRTI